MVSVDVFGESAIGEGDAEQGDGSRPDLGNGECVGNAFADEEARVLLSGSHNWPVSRVGGDPGGGVVVFAASGLVGVEVAGLEVDGPVVVVDGKDDGGASGGESLGAGKLAGAGVGADVVGSQDLVVEAAVVEVLEHGLAGLAPEGFFTAGDVVGEGAAGVGSRSGSGCGVGPESRSSGCSRPWTVGVDAVLLREVFEGLADAEPAGFEEEVDCGSAGAAGVTVPALVAAAGGEDADRGCAAGLGSVLG
jgi:hypothetical protein